MFALPRSQRFFPLFLEKVLLFLALRFKCMFHFQSIFIYGVRWGSKFTFFRCPSISFWTLYTFLNELAWHLYQKSFDFKYKCLFLDSQFCFTHLYIYPYTMWQAEPLHSPWCPCPSPHNLRLCRFMWQKELHSLLCECWDGEYSGSLVGSVWSHMYSRVENLSLLGQRDGCDKRGRKHLRMRRTPPLWLALKWEEGSPQTRNVCSF